MIARITVLAEGEADRASTVGWVVLIVALGIGILLAIVFAVVMGENLMDRLSTAIRPYSGLFFFLLVIGLGLLAVAYIVASQGVGILGGAVLLMLWRISERAM